MLKILIVEDAPIIRQRLTDTFSRQLSGYEVLTADNRDDAIALVASEEPDLILLDLVIPPTRRTAAGTWEEGREVLRWTRKARPQTRVIVLSSMGPLTHDFIKEEGADDFFTKDSEQDWREEKLLAQVEAMLGHLVCRSPAMQKLREQIGRLSERDRVIVIENLERNQEGTGREFFARLIHHNSLQARRDFVRLPVAALQPATLLSDLIGEHGEFPSCGLLNSARVGALFFDGLEHFGMLDRMAQAQLATVLAGRSDDGLRFMPLNATTAVTSHCRVYFSTTVPLDDLRDAGTLIPELHAELRNASRFALPSLSLRPEDVPELLDCLRRENNRGRDAPVTRIEPEARELAERWTSEGLVRNARELAGIVRSAMRGCAGAVLREEDLRAAAPVPPPTRVAPPREVYERVVAAYREEDDEYRKAVETEDKMRHLEKLATLGQMVAGLAHEIKNPLTSVMGFAATIRRPEVTPEQIQEFAQVIVDEARRINELVNDVREYGKTDPTRNDTCRAAEVVAESLRLMQIGGGNFRRARLAKDLAANPAVAISRDRLKQVLLNLLKNAAEALDKSEGVITMATAERDGAAEVRIGDNGCGIAPAALSRIWEPFYTTKGDEGTGLGLDICRKIIESHDGKITVESTLSEGTTFTVRVPLA